MTTFLQASSPHDFFTRFPCQDRGNPLHRTAGPYIGVTFEPLQTLVAVKLRSDCMSVLVGVAVKPMSELR